jgi:hypothetical protein
MNVNRPNPVPVSPDELRAEVRKLERGLSRRLVVGGGAALIVVVGFVVDFFVFRGALERIGSIMTIVGAGCLIGQILLRRSRVIPDTAETECFRFYREEIERQRDFHRGWWLWSRIAAFLPGLFVFMVGVAKSYPQLAPLTWFQGATIPPLCALAVVLNLRLAQKYQRRIDALDRSQKGE